MGNEKLDKAHAEGVKDGQRGGFLDDLLQGNTKVVSGSEEEKAYNDGYDNGATNRSNKDGERYHSWDGTGINDPSGDNQASGIESKGSSDSYASYSKHSDTPSSSGGVVEDVEPNYRRDEGYIFDTDSNYIGEIRRVSNDDDHDAMVLIFSPGVSEHKRREVIKACIKSNVEKRAIRMFLERRFMGG